MHVVSNENNMEGITTILGIIIIAIFVFRIVVSTQKFSGKLALPGLNNPILAVPDC
jgi:hypothetical protein